MRAEIEFDKVDLKSILCLSSYINASLYNKVDMIMENNEFAKLRQMVLDIVEPYRQVRKHLGTKEYWNSRTIESRTEPFVNGYFTLAIVGKVSAGKSTFINALLGCKDMLPTGHDQTTCGITYIEYGEKSEVTIVFGDKHTVRITDNVMGMVKQHVAIPERFHDLPVNDIDEKILKGYTFEEIWDHREELERRTMCLKIDKELLKEYVQNRHKKDIAVEVRIKCPFAESLKGWRIIDTPGIGAIGGIEIKTRELLATQKEDGTRMVDAIIFIQDGSDTLDSSDTRQFMTEQLDKFTESDKRRTFFVLTHGAEKNFILYKENKLNSINRFYGDNTKCITYVDSLLYTFLQCADKNGYDLKNYDDIIKPEDWQENDWDATMTLLDNVKRCLKNNHESINNETMRRQIKEISNFDFLKAEIDSFCRTEKEQTLLEIIRLIDSDYKAMIKQLQHSLNTLDGGIEEIQAERKKLDLLRHEYNEKYRKAAKEINREEINKRFWPFRSKFLEDIDSAESEESARTVIENISDEVQSIYNEVIDDVKRRYSDFLNEYDSNSVTFGTIDFEAISKEAESISTSKKKIKDKKTHFCSDDEPAVYKTIVDQKKKLEHFKAFAKREATTQFDDFLEQMKEQIDNIRSIFAKELVKRDDSERLRLLDLEHKLYNKEEVRKEIEYKKNYVQRTSEELNDTIKLNGYGCN